MAILGHKFRLYFVFLRNPGKIHITGLVMGAGGRNNNKNINIVPLRVVYVDHLITNIWMTFILKTLTK